MAAAQAYLPWATGFSGAAPVFQSLACQFVEVHFLIHGRDRCTRSLSMPAETTCADLKGHLAVNGLVSTCDGLELKLAEDGPTLDNTERLQLTNGQTLHLFRATEMVSVTAFVNGEDDVYELVVPAEVTGATLREHILQVTAGALHVSSVYVPQENAEAYLLGHDQAVVLKDDQAICVERVQAVAEAVHPVTKPGLMSTFLTKFRGQRGHRGGNQEFSIQSASNVKVSGSKIACTSKNPWAGCVVFDVQNPDFFEIAVQLTEDCPKDDVEGLAGRWMLGVVPTVFASTKTEKQRHDLFAGGYFVTVCHGHPAKVRVPSMPRGTCGEDLAAVPAELRAGQTLTLRWASSGQQDVPGTLTVQVDDMDAVTIPYAVPPFEQVKPCLVLGAKPAEVRVLQLESHRRIGGA